MLTLRLVFLGVLLTIASLASGCAASGAEVPSEVREAVEGTWRSERGTSLTITVEDRRSTDCTTMVDCRWLDKAEVHAKAESPTCGSAMLYGVVQWTADGQRTLRLEATGAYVATGDVTSDSASARGKIALHEVTESPIGIQDARITCVWDELRDSPSLVRMP